MDCVNIFDTTLRDGEQCPGAAMTLNQKLAVAEQLDALRVDVVEAGFPVASAGDFAAVQAIARTLRHASVAGLCRAVDRDIEQAWDAVKHARRPRIHTFASTSPIHRAKKLRLDKAEVLALVSHSVAFARNLCGDVEWSAEDATRTEPDFLCDCVVAAVRAGATTINLPDTVGYSAFLPDGRLAYGEMFRAVMAHVAERVPESVGRVVYSAHCHDDLGLAVANSLSAVMAGARQVECTINGIGERAGNAPLEEVVMALNVRRDAMGIGVNVVTKGLMVASALVSEVSGFAVAPNKAVVGANAFAHASGIHQDGMLKDASTYEIMRPEQVGWGRGALPLTKHSGRAALRAKLEALGCGVAEERLADVFMRFKTLADTCKVVGDEEVRRLVMA